MRKSGIATSPEVKVPDFPLFYHKIIDFGVIMPVLVGNSVISYGESKEYGKNRKNAQFSDNYRIFCLKIGIF